MLSRSSSSHEAELRSIVESTATIVFLGTPHRGSQDVAALGEVVRSVISSLGMETTPVILDALGLKTTDLLRAQEDFSTLWQRYDFRVKTFQEGLSLAKLKKKVVPDHSSIIGDVRERAETLQANHMEMCRFSGKGDPNYRKVAGELRSMYYSILRLKAVDAPARQRIRRYSRSIFSAASSKEPPNAFSNDQANEACLRSLWFPAINIRYQSLERPADKTCSWLFNLDSYQDWFSSKTRQESHGLLWLKGKPGAGKSTLMKEAFRRAVFGQAESNYRTAAFFFSAKGDVLEHSSLGLFQSLLYQLLPGDRENLQRFYKLWGEKNKSRREGVRTETSIWTEPELKPFFESVLHSQTRTTIIFIDALDECDESSIRPIAYFWREITNSAYKRGVDLNVCLSSRHFPIITLSDCPEIIVERHNYDDIATYVDYKLQICISTQKSERELLMKSILSKTDGVFLWVVLVVEDILKSWDEGKGMSLLIKQVMDVPKELETLFSSMFSNLKPHEKKFTVKFFQWAILATKPLRLHEWRHILAFIRQPDLRSLREWRQSDDFIETDEQLEKQIRNISRGLVEVYRVHAGDSQEDRMEAISIHAGAGSLDLEHGDSRIVQVIHESVRKFFLTSDGFFILDPGLRMDLNPIGRGHLSIMETCLNYLNIKELNELVQARIYAATRPSSSRDKRTWGPVSRQTKSSSSDGGVLLSARSMSRLNLLNLGTQSYASLQLPMLSNMLDACPSTHANQTRSHDSLSQEGHLLLRRNKLETREEETSKFEILRSSEFIPSRKIIEWLAKNDAISVKSTSPERSPCVSTSYLPEMGHQRLLEDDPALLSYATFKLFTHAQLANKYEADLRYFIERLKDEATWARWVALREDIPYGTKLRSYAIKMGLSAWIKSPKGSNRSISDDSVWQRALSHEERKQLWIMGYTGKRTNRLRKRGGGSSEESSNSRESLERWERRKRRERRKRWERSERRIRTPGSARVEEFCDDRRASLARFDEPRSPFGFKHSDNWPRGVIGSSSASSELEKDKGEEERERRKKKKKGAVRSEYGCGYNDYSSRWIRQPRSVASFSSAGSHGA